MAAEVPPRVNNDVIGRHSWLELAVHLVAEKVEALEIAELLPPRVVALRNVLIVEAPDNFAHFREDYEDLLALQAQLHLHVIEQLGDDLVVLVLDLVAAEDFLADFIL